MFLYATIQSRLGGIGRFQKREGNILRYIIGDIEGVKKFISLTHNKFRTPKNERFNQLIQFMNQKYALNNSQSILNESNILKNNWFTGFVEADGHFGIKYREFKEKGNNKRSVSRSVSILFRLDQRSYDRLHSLSLRPLMAKLAKALECNLLEFNSSKRDSVLERGGILSVSVSAISKLKILVDYFHTFPLLGVKGLDYKDWFTIYNMILSKEHLSDAGRFKIKEIVSPHRNK